ncbi:hypothetical protein K1719_014680 [Acacia pycnantha]|nr:hypothetical protein K1719_014680 [Acacia pycnantha]
MLCSSKIAHMDTRVRIELLKSGLVKMPLVLVCCWEVFLNGIVMRFASATPAILDINLVKESATSTSSSNVCLAAEGSDHTPDHIVSIRGPPPIIHVLTSHGRWWYHPCPFNYPPWINQDMRCSFRLSALWFQKKFGGLQVSGMVIFSKFNVLLYEGERN